VKSQYYASNSVTSQHLYTYLTCLTGFAFNCKRLGKHKPATVYAA